MTNSGDPLNGKEVVHPNLRRELVGIFSDIFQVNLDPEIEDISQPEIEMWDSINHLQLVLALEEVFQVALSDEEIPDLTSLQKVETLLVKRGIDSKRGKDEDG